MCVCVCASDYYRHYHLMRRLVDLEKIVVKGKKEKKMKMMTKHGVTDLWAIMIMMRRGIYRKKNPVNNFIIAEKCCSNIYFIMI